MKKIITSALTFALCLSLFTACGKSRTEHLMDRYTKLANTYSSLSADIAKLNDAATLGRFSSLGIELTDIATEFAKGGEDIPDETLDEIESSLKEIGTALAAFSDNAAQ